MKKKRVTGRGKSHMLKKQLEAHLIDDLIDEVLDYEGRVVRKRGERV
jgi:hypothetical protein